LEKSWGKDVGKIGEKWGRCGEVWRNVGRKVGEDVGKIGERWGKTWGELERDGECWRKVFEKRLAIVFY